MRRSRYLVFLILVIFFVISFITNILGPIIPDIIVSFQLSYTLAALLPFAFFLAYGLMSIPAGVLAVRLGERAILLAAFVLVFAGSAAFAVSPGYRVAVGSLFVIGTGMAMLQVVINPLLREAGGEEHFAFNSVLASLAFFFASFLSPRVYTWLLAQFDREQPGWVGLMLARVVPEDRLWSSLYWLFAVMAVGMLVVIALSPIPRSPPDATETVGLKDHYLKLIRRPVAGLYFLGILLYVGCEQGIADWTSEFLSAFHSLDPRVAGASTISWYWGLMAVGCAVGMILLKLYDSRRILIATTLGALASFSVAVFGPAATAPTAFALIGLFEAMMWGILISLALNSVPDMHAAFSGILMTAIVGGAIFPLVIGGIGGFLGLRAGLAVLYVNLLFILGIGFWARPLINNQTVRSRGEDQEKVVVR